MRYEKDFRKGISDEQINKILHELEDIRDNLANELADNTAVYDDMAELIIKISDHILREQTKTKERVRKIMSGQILELYSERVARISKEKLNEGIALGLSQVIINMLKLNLPLETISAATGYSNDEILKISQTL